MDQDLILQGISPSAQNATALKANRSPTIFHIWMQTVQKSSIFSAPASVFRVAGLEHL